MPPHWRLPSCRPPGAPGRCRSCPIRRRRQAPAATPSRAEQLDALFAELKSASDAAAAKQAEDAIIAIWLQSGSDTVDLLMSWSVQAIAKKEYAEALDILDRVVTLKPDYVEGWNKRATVYFLTDKYGQSISDIEHVLVLEPRHFGALTGLGSIFRALGEDQRAIEAFSRRWRSIRISATPARSSASSKRRPGRTSERPGRLALKSRRCVLTGSAVAA